MGGCKGENGAGRYCIRVSISAENSYQEQVSKIRMKDLGKLRLRAGR